MKATINTEGVLFIKPESPLEDYALQNWESNFRMHQPKEEGEASLIIARYKEKDKKEKKAKKEAKNG